VLIESFFGVTPMDMGVAPVSELDDDPDHVLTGFWNVPGVTTLRRKTTTRETASSTACASTQFEQSENPCERVFVFFVSFFFRTGSFSPDESGITSCNVVVLAVCV